MQGRDQGLENRLRWVAVVMLTVLPTLLGVGVFVGLHGNVFVQVCAIILGPWVSFCFIFIGAPYIAPDRRYLIKAKRALAARNIDDAIDNLRLALNARQGFHEARILLGTCLAIKGQPTQAVAELDKVIVVKKRDVSAYIARAWAKAAQRDYIGAMEDANEAIRLKPLNPEPYSQLASIQYAHKNYLQTIVEAKKAIQLGRRDKGTPTLMGKSYFMLQMYQEAADAFDMALEFNYDTDGELFLNRGQALRVLKEYQLALDDLNEAVERLPDSGQAYFERGLIHLKMKNYQLAVVDYDQAIRLKANDYASYVNRGIAWYSLDDFEKAKVDYRQSLTLQENGYAHINLSYVQLIEGDYPAATAHFEKGHLLLPELKGAIVGLALAHYLQGEVDKAGEEWAGLVKEEGRYREVEWVIEEHGQHPKMAALIRRFFEDGLKAQ